MAKDVVRIGCYAAFWGDTPHAARQLLQVDDVDYLVSDYLSEITMALLARSHAKDPSAGHIQDAVDVLAAVLPEIHERGIKVVTNAGALNPAACAAALRVAAEACGVAVKVAAVEGDGLLDRASEVLGDDPTDMFTGLPLPAHLDSLNAYIGARPIAAALAAGAQIVVAGRCADASVVLGPLLHEFGWVDDDYDLLAAGTLVGHILECGPQSTGGNHTDWFAVPGWDDMGYPIAEVRADGTAVITKPAGTGGLVSPATVAEQIVYEIGDPGAYLTPDVVCDWRSVRTEQVGPDRVLVSGARGSAPTTTYKATATVSDGFRVMTSAMFAGVDAGGRARRAAHAAVARAERLVAEQAFAPFDEVSIEVVGAGDTRGPAHQMDDAVEAVVKIGLRHERREALDVFSRELASLALVAPGMTGLFAGRPRIAPVFKVLHVLVDKSAVPVTYGLDDDAVLVDVHAGRADAVTSTPELPDRASPSLAGARTVPLRRLAYARSGDKGDKANIGVIARRPEYLPLICEQVTTARVAEHFGHYLSGAVHRWRLDGLSAVNIVLDAVLGGCGGTSTLRFDPQGKSYAAMLLSLPIVVPAGFA